MIWTIISSVIAYFIGVFGWGEIFGSIGASIWAKDFQRRRYSECFVLCAQKLAQKYRKAIVIWSIIMGLLLTGAFLITEQVFIGCIGGFALSLIKTLFALNSYKQEFEDNIVSAIGNVADQK